MSLFKASEVTPFLRRAEWVGGDDQLVSGPNYFFISSSIHSLVVLALPTPNTTR